MLTPYPAIAVKDSVTYEELASFMEIYMPQLFMYAIRQGGEIAAPPYSIYYNWDPEGLILVECGVPLEEAIGGDGTFMPTETPGGKAVKAVHMGPYEELVNTYEALEQYMKVMKYEPLGLAYEVYVNDPSEEPNPAKWETHIYFPIK
jgi:AraC family transcriptional regulator